jgi:hypothetical protein
MKVLEADLQKLLVGQRGPGEFLAHRCANLENRGTDGVTAWRPRQPPLPALAAAARAPIFPCEGPLAMMALAGRRRSGAQNGLAK